ARPPAPARPPRGGGGGRGERRGGAPPPGAAPGRRPAAVIAAWAATLAAAGSLAGRAGLGTLLTAAFILQVTPSIWAAFRTTRPTGISAGTWLLILGELACWLTFGLHKSDPRLIALGTTGVAASVLMLTRTCWGKRQAAGRGTARQMRDRSSGDFVTAHHGPPER